MAAAFAAGAPGGVLLVARGVPLIGEPGTTFAYSDTGYIMLGAALEQRANPAGWRYASPTESGDDSIEPASSRIRTCA